MISQEKATKLVEFLNADETRTRELFSLEPSVAVERINKHGYSFTDSDLTEYGEALQSLAKQENGELDLDAMDNVAGGSVAALVLSGGFALIANLSPPRNW